MLLGFDLSYYTVARGFKVRELGFAYMKYTLGQFVHKSSHPNIDVFWQRH